MERNDSISLQEVLDAVRQQPVERDDTISLQDYLTVLRRQAWIIVLTAVVVVIAAVGFALAQTPRYEAETELVVEPVRRTDDVTLEDLLGPQRAVVETERVVITSRPVAERVGEQLDLQDMRPVLRNVRVEVLRDTRILRIVTTHTDPAAAAAISNAFAEAYLDYRREQAVDELMAARATVQRRADDLRDQIEVLDDTIEADTAGTADDISGLELERQALAAQLGQLLGQLSDIGDVAETVAGGGAILTPAEEPETPVSPRIPRTGALALVLGVLLGIGVAFLRDHIDDVIRDENDFKRATGNRPILGRIPRWAPEDGAADRLATLAEPSSLASESYRELSAGVRFLLLANEREGSRPRGRAIMVCSPNAEEGKTSTASNLAVAAAGVGLKTLLVDTDLRRGTVAKRFGLGRTTGLSDVLLRGDRLIEHVADVGVPNLLILPGGTVPPNPAEVLASPPMRALQQELLRQADLIIYDSPAVLAVPDALELGRFVDLAILVARAGVTSRRHVAAAVERLEQIGTDIAGTVLNDIDHKTGGYYYSYYYREASDPKDVTPSRPGGRRGRKKGKDAARDPQPSTAEQRTGGVRTIRRETPAPTYPPPWGPPAPGRAGQHADRPRRVPAATPPDRSRAGSQGPGPTDGLQPSAPPAPPPTPASEFTTPPVGPPLEGPTPYGPSERAVFPVSGDDDHDHGANDPEEHLFSGPHRGDRNS